MSIYDNLCDPCALFTTPGQGVKRGPDWITPQTFVGIAPDDMPVPTALTISDSDAERLAAPGKEFMRAQLDPALRHV